MYPFETDTKEFFTEKTSNEIKKYLAKNINSKEILQITSDDKFYGKVNSNNAIFELGQFPTKNAWRPIIIIVWTEYEDKTRVVTKYSLDKFILLLISILPIFGLYTSIKLNMIIPFVTTFIIYLIILFGIFQLIYSNSKKRTTTLLNELLSNL